jgi:hypothetical protein
LHDLFLHVFFFIKGGWHVIYFFLIFFNKANDTSLTCLNSDNQKGDWKMLPHHQTVSWRQAETPQTESVRATI